MTNIGILTKLGGECDEFTSKERQIKNYIQKNLQTAATLAIHELSEKTGVSKATISRFCRKLGYADYREFSLALARETTVSYQRINEDMDSVDSALEIAGTVLKTERKALEQTYDMLKNVDLNGIADLLLNARRVCIFAVGGSACVAMDLYHKFSRMGITCDMQTDITFQKVLATQLKEGCVAWIASLSGYDGDMIEIARMAHSRNAKVVSMLNDFNSPLARNCDYTLYGAFLDDFLYTGTTESRLALMYITDVLYSLMSVRGAPETIAKLQETRLILTARSTREI